MFAWTPSDMLEIPSEVITHKFTTNPNFKPDRQKKWSFTLERQNAIKEEVDKLLASNFIQKVCYPNWLANVVMVKKVSRKWRICVDNTDLNKVCPMDSYPLSRID